MDRERPEPAGDALLAVGDPTGLKQEVGDEVLEHERQENRADGPKGNGGTYLRHISIQLSTLLTYLGPHR